MALITNKNLLKLNKERVNVHGEVEATYTVFKKDGKKYFQIDTYGAPDRKYRGKCSQSIQMDEDMVDHLIDLFKKEL